MRADTIAGTGQVQPTEGRPRGCLAGPNNSAMGFDDTTLMEGTRANIIPNQIDQPNCFETTSPRATLGVVTVVRSRRLHLASWVSREPTRPDRLQLATSPLGPYQGVLSHTPLSLIKGTRARQDIWHVIASGGHTDRCEGTNEYRLLPRP